MRELKLGSRGKVPVWIRALVILAFAQIVPFALGVTTLIADLGGVRLSPAVVFGAPIALVVALLACLLKRGEVSRWIRAVVVLTVAHAALLAAAGALFVRFHPNPWKVPFPTGVLVERLLAVLLGLSILSILLPRRFEAVRLLRGATIVLLSHAALFALALPLLARYQLTLSCSWKPGVATDDVRVVLAALVLPALIVGGSAWLSPRRTMPSATRAVLGALVGLLAIVGAAALVKDLPDASHGELFSAYTAFIDVVIAELSLAAFAITLFALLHALGQARALRAFAPSREGSIVGTAHADGDNEIVAWFRYVDWTRGVLPEVAPFSLHSDRGPLDVPASARLIAPLPPDLWRLRQGEGIAALRAGEQIAASGYVDPPAGPAYRASPRPVPPSSGLLVASWAFARGSSSPFCAQQLLLSVVQPCLVYLFVSTMVLVPGVVAFLSRL